MRTAPFSKKLMEVSPARLFLSFCRVGKAKRAHHFSPRSPNDGGHGASAPLPTLRSFRRLPDLVLRLRFEIARLVALVQLVGRIARDTVDHAPALHRRAFCDRIGPA